MKKCIFIIALVCASVLSQARSHTECGYPFQYAAMAGAATYVSQFNNPEQEPLWQQTTFTQQANGTWCFSMPINQLIVPLPAPASIRPTLNTLASGCYATQAEADNAFENAMTEQKHCHFVDEDASGVYSPDLVGGDTPPRPPIWCFSVKGW